MNKLSRYNEFVVENVQAAKALLKKIGKSPDDTAYKQIIQWLGNALGYTHWFVKQHFQNGATLEELKQIIDTIKAEKAVIDKFSTPVIQLENCEKFWDEYLAQSRNAEAKAAYNEFPAKQKKLLDLSNAEHIQMLKDLCNDEDKNNFLKKLASYTDSTTLIKNLKNHLYLKTSKITEELLNELKKDDVNIVYADVQKEIIITTVNYDQIVKFCSDAAWCIVRSKGMFDSYVDNYDYFGTQFVIFLPGRVDLVRKIGVTRGHSKWITAHDVRDGRVDEEQVYKILAEYDVKDPKSIFLDEVKKQISDTNINFDIYPVEALINVGISKEEILENKNIYSSKYRFVPVNSDLYFFTQDEIEKWNLYDKTELTLGDLILTTAEKIVEKKLWLRVPGFKFEDFELLAPIDYETATKIAKEANFQQDAEAKTFVKSRREILKKKLTQYDLSTFRYYSLIRTKSELSEDFDLLFAYFINSIGKKVSPKQLANLSQRKNWTFYTYVLRLASQYYKLDKDYFKRIFGTKKDLVKTISELESDKTIIPENQLGNKQAEIIPLLKEYMINIVLESETPIVDPEVIKTIQDLVSIEVYEKIYKNQRAKVIEDAKWEISNAVNKDDGIDFNILRFWNLDKTIPLSFWESVFGRRIRLSTYSSRIRIQKIHDYFLELKYDVKTDEYFEFISKIIDKLSCDFWIFALKNDLVNQSRLEEFLDLVEKGKLEIYSVDEKEFQDLLDTESAAKFMENYLFSSVVKITKKGNIYNPDWLGTYYPILKRNKDKIKGDFAVTLVISLAQLKAEEQLDNLNIKMSDLSQLKSLADKISGLDKWDKTTLDENQQKLIWKYLEKNIDYPQDDKTEVDRIMLAARWIFDKKNIGKWFDQVKKVKDNEVYWARSFFAGKKKRTNRMYALSYLLAYLAKENKAKDVAEVFSKFTFNKFEKKWLLNSTEPPGANSWEYKRDYNSKTKEALESIWKDVVMKKESWIITDFEWFKY